VIAETEAKERETLRLNQKVRELSEILREVGEREEIDEGALRKVRRGREVVRVTKVFLSTGSEKVWAYGGERCEVFGSDDLLGQPLCCFR